VPAGGTGAGRGIVYASAVPQDQEWDVAIIGAGPAGLSAAHAAASAGARAIVLERAVHPRYKTCGGGLIGTSLTVASGSIDVPARDHVRTATVTLDGRRSFTREERDPLLAMVTREEFDDALRRGAAAAGATVRQRSPVRGITEDGDYACARLADGTSVRARVLVGADGSSGVSARYAGVRYGQVDLGLELEIAVPPPVADRWRGRMLLDWGPIPGSYGWVFPKGDRLTVGVIASRGQGERTRSYLRDFTARLGLASFRPDHDSGHLTRCRSDGSPVRRGRVLVVGDAAGLLEPWTREGISFALRSGALAGAVAAQASASTGPEQLARALGQYRAALDRELLPEMAAGGRLLAAFSRHPGAFHTGLATAKGWRTFAKFCRSETTWRALVGHRQARMALSLLALA
jgi:geranylgeranyl reductase family protein